MKEVEIHDEAAAMRSCGTISGTPPGDVSDVVTFGSCVMHPKRRELRRDGRLQAVPKKVFDCLQYLLDHRDRVVDKTELIDAVWGGACVSDSVIARAVMKARRLVGDDACSPSTIKTVHGIGYRFIASVTLFAQKVGTSRRGNETVDATSSHEPISDSRQCFCDWAYSRALRAVKEDRWLVAARLFELAISLDFDEQSHTVVIEGRGVDA